MTIYTQHSLFRYPIREFATPEYFLSKVRSIILDNIENEQFDARLLATQVHLSISQLNRRLNQLVDCPAGTLIRQVRLHYAAELLTSNTLSVGTVAFRVGFANQASFCRSFKQHFGCTPSRYGK